MIQYPRGLLICLLVFFLHLVLSVRSTAQVTYVYPGAEHVIFSEHALNTNLNAVWSTDRSSTPGYFSAIRDAVYEGGAPESSFLVDGYVKYYRDVSASASSFLFPVGQATEYRPVVISGDIPDNFTFATAWFNGDPGVVTDPTDGATHDRNSRGPGVVSVLPLGFWDWQTLAGTAAGMTITVSIPDVTAYAHTQNLILVGWDGSQWINLSGAAGGGPYSLNWADGNTDNALLTGTGQSNITALGVGSLNFILPLKLHGFTGKVKDCTAELIWTTSDEVNTSHFTIQSTTDGTNWQTVGTKEAQGFGDGQEYRYQVQQTERIVRYRILMADKDGQAKYSPVISLSSACAKTESINAFPNPVHAGAGPLHIIIQSSQHRKAVVLLRGAAGHVIHRASMSLNEGYNTLNLPIHSSTPGTYLLSVTDDRGNNLYPLKKIIKK